MNNHNRVNKVIIIVLIITSFIFGFYIGRTTKKVPPIVENKTDDDISVQLAQEITVLRPSYMSARELDSIVKGTPLYGLGKYFLEAEKQSGIGADILLAIAIHESNYGRNYWSGSVKYNGRWYPCNQIFSWGVTDSGVKPWAFYYSKRDCLLGGINPITGKYQKGVPELLYELYLSPSGTYYSGETLWAIGQHYASDGSWYRKVESVLNSFPKTEMTKAQEWIVGTKILKPYDKAKGIKPPRDYWDKPLTRRELSIILYRIQER